MLVKKKKNDFFGMMWLEFNVVNIINRRYI